MTILIIVNKFSHYFFLQSEFQLESMFSTPPAAPEPTQPPPVRSKTSDGTSIRARRKLTFHNGSEPPFLQLRVED